VALIVLGVRVSVIFQIILRVVGRLGSEVQVSGSFQSLALRMFVCPVMFFRRPVCRPVPLGPGQEGHFSVVPVLSCFRETPQWRRCVFYGPVYPDLLDPWSVLSMSKLRLPVWSRSRSRSALFV